MAVYNDFFGEGGTGVSVSAPVKTAAQIAKDKENEKLRLAAEAERKRLASANLAAKGRQNLLNSGQKQLTTAPIQWGPGALSAAQLQEMAKGAKEAADKRSGGYLGDLARLGTAAVRTVYGTGIDTAADAVGAGEIPRAIVDTPGYVFRAAADEAADQTIPGGSGTYGSNLIPSKDGTGGDQFYPSETLQSGSYGDGYRGVGNNPEPGGAGGGGGGMNSAAILGTLEAGSTEIQADIARRSGASMDELRNSQAAIDTSGQFDSAGNPKVGQAASQATDALGPAPQVDMGLADRRLGEYEESLGMSREVIDRLLNGPSTAERLGSQTLRSQLALARSAAGGPGAVAAAFRNAQNNAPELMAQATEQARQEELQKLTAAGTVASNFAQAALGARGQDVNIAQANVNAGVQVQDMVTRLTGTQLELDQKNSELMGQLARDVAAMDFDWAKLSTEQAAQALDRYLKIYGIDEDTRTKFAAIQAGGQISAKDILNGLVGLTGAAGSIYATYAAGKDKE